MEVRELMTTNVAWVRRSDSLSAAAQCMWERDCGAVPVIEDETGSVVGMLTDRDICMACWTKNRPPCDICVVDAMSQSLYHCLPDDSVEAAERLMRSSQVRRIPVLDRERRLVGILSLADIVTRAHEHHDDVRDGRGYDFAPQQITATLATICQPKAIAVHSAAS